MSANTPELSPSELSEIVAHAKSALIERGARQELTIAFFDLAESTLRKLSRGHIEGVQAAMDHSNICKDISSRFGGKAIKDLGDGVLITFSDPLHGLLAAINTTVALQKHAKLSTKVGLTTGLVEFIRIGGQDDVLGNAVDRCARLQSLASAGQIIIDRPIFEAIRSYLPPYKTIRVGEPTTVDLRGIGETEVRAVISKSIRGSSLLIREPFFINEGGRLPMAEKVRFLRGARSEVIEIGTGITTFASYFHSFDRALFKEPVREVIKAGVSFKCLALDPKAPAARYYSRDRKEPLYLSDITKAMNSLREVRDEFVEERLLGSLELYTYTNLPCFHAMCVDIGLEKPSTEGRLIISNYMFATKRADCPVMRFTSASNPKMYQTYWHSIRELVKASDRRW